MRSIAKMREVLAAFSQFGETNLTRADVFLAVCQFPDHSLKEYADMLGLSQSTASRHLLDLGEMRRDQEPGLGLLDQHPDRMDRRRNVYYLTPKGKQLLAKLNGGD